ncbi:hypothetical protein Mal4_15740 [Maioricimonas rarisocia]|uniref:Uncharacterized protein n=1 Tax=Maioricimonas rarisocia TaxID=2528026 RepID=A0A517Z459_9PLAN|nr:hypothetical protein [Maioricimonas rarisocia]QDU37264.1 hypothetical protein Mal4_15740 [Maioricimonas rarisocia]
MLRIAPFRTARPALAILSVIVLAQTSCVDQEPIETYTVQRASQPAPAPPIEGSADTAPNTVGVAWFVKLLGPQEAVDRHVNDFGKLVRSIRIDRASGEMSWTLPDGWTEEKGSGLRFATFKVPAEEPPLEVTVIRLAARDLDSPEYLRGNVNRWRNQVSLTPVEGDDWKDKMEDGEVTELKLAGQDGTLVDLRGETEELGDARMLVAVIPVAAPSRPATPPPSSTSPSAPLTYTVPEGWEERPASSFRLVSFMASGDGGDLDVSVSTAGGSVLANINRWRGQVGLPTVSEAELEAGSQAIDVDGTTGTLVELAGSEQTILGVVLPREGRTWFFKGTGPNAAAERERDAFETFVRSVKFTN